MKRLKNRPAFTLTEILVVLAIIAVGIALLAPKLLMATAAARRTQCRNNLAQLALAIHTYETTHGVFPPGTINLTGPIQNIPEGYHVGWTVQILPFLEQNGIYDNVDPLFGIYDSSLASIQIPAFTCPGNSVLDSSGNLFPSDYAASYGDTETGIDNTNNGVMFMNSAVSQSDIRDGSANTILFGEKTRSPADLGWFSGTSSTLRNTANPPGNPKDLALEFGDPRNGGFGSPHKQGSMFSFADGSVRMLRNSIDAGLFRKLGNRHDGQLIKKEQFLDANDEF